MNFKEAQEYLDKLSESSRGQGFPGKKGLERMKALLKEIGNPHDKFKAIHVAGTSGKGSTAFICSRLLAAHDLKAGLTLSPHLVDIRERVQINNQNISKEKFAEYLNEVRPAVERINASYFEALTALAFHAFSKENVDYAVVETGLGGTYDATNVFSEEKIAVITKIGMDHVHVLGDSLEEIAKNKADIIGAGNAVVLEQDREIMDIIERKCSETGAQTRIVSPTKNIKVGEEGTVFDFSHEKISYKSLKLGMHGLHQAENCSLALAAALEAGIKLEERKVRETLGSLKFPGRIEIMEIDGKRVVLDAAHNPQKMQALCNSLQRIWPGRKFNFIVAFKKGKDHAKMMEQIRPLAKKIIITCFSEANQGLRPIAEDPKKIAGKEDVVVQSPKNAAGMLEEITVITGSLYLIAEIRGLLE